MDEWRGFESPLGALQLGLTIPQSPGRAPEEPMSNLRKLAQHRAHQSGQAWAVVRRSHGLSVLSLRLARGAKGVEILEVVR